MSWVPIAAWCAAAVVAVVVLGFCAYEISWKARRLRRDVRELQRLTGQLGELRAGLATARQRLSAAGLR